MSRYDYESTQQYAEQKFAEAKQYNEEQIKKQEKFSKRLLAFDTVVKGANALINQRADELESSFGPAKAKYKSYIQNAEATTTYWNEVQKNGGKSYLQKQIFDSYLAAAKDTNPYKDIESISSWINEQATEKANELYTALEQKAIQAKDVPTMKDFMDDYENFTEIQAPRTLFGAATSGIKRILGRENSETLEYKKQIAKDKLFNTDVIKEIDEFAQFADVYDKLGYNTPELLTKMNEQFVEGKSGELGKKISKTEIKVMKNNSKPGYTKEKAVSFVTYTDGSVATPKTLLESETPNDSLLMSEVGEMTLVNRVRTEHVPEFIRLLKGDGNVALKANASVANAWALENNAYKENLDDLKKANDIIDTNYEDELKSKFTEDGMPMFYIDPVTKEFRVSADFLPQAKAEGWDAQTFRKNELIRLGINQKEKNEIVKTKNGVSKELNNFNEITNDTFKELASNPNSLISKATMSLVGNKTSGIVDLGNGNPIDLDKFFPDSGLKGMANVSYDIDNRKYYYKETKEKGNGGFTVVDITPDKTLTPFQTMLKESKDTKIIARDYMVALGKVKPSGMLQRYFKETEATAQTKEDFKDIYKELQEKYPRAFIEGNTWAMRNPLEAQEITDTINNFLKNR
jgi:hypothetical protein